MLLLVGWVLAAECDPVAALPEVVARGDREAYLCVAKAEAGKDVILAEIDKDPLGEHPRLTRALVLWLLERTDRPMDPALVGRLSPADRRLLADGIRARRGRASPSPEHASVFKNLPWYEPVAGYNDARLRPIDRANLDVVDPAVRPEPPAPEPPGEGEDAPPPKGGEKPVTAETPNLCGCDAGAGATGGVGLLAMMALLARRRRAR